jgi:sterol-4alpha-carboxylate 3-dehydrogenase (decarboxylating)
LLNFPSEGKAAKSNGGANGAHTTNGHVSEPPKSKIGYPPIAPPSTPIPTPNPSKYDLTNLLSSSFPSLRSRYPPTNLSATTVHVLDLRCTQHVFPGATYHSADITNASAVLEVFRKVKPDVVINTASPSWEAPADLLQKVNIEGTRILVEVAGGKKHGDWGGHVKAFVHTSSASVVHDADSSLTNADERYPYVFPNPREYYSETKVVAEQLVLEANANEEASDGGKMLTCAIRPAGVIGEGDRGGFSGGILRTASVAPSWQLHIQLGNNENLFDNTYVHNVCFGTLCATTALLETYRRKQQGLLGGVLEHEKVDGEAFNVTNNSPAYFWDSSHYLYSRYGRDLNRDKMVVLPTWFAYYIGAAAEVFNYLSGRKGKFNRQTLKYATIHRYYSCKKLMERTGYVPIVALDEGFERSVKWFKEDEER